MLHNFTIPVCPNCGAKEEAVGKPSSGKWHCFECRTNGVISYTTTDTTVDSSKASEVD